MGAETKIAWTDHTFNPWIGCAKVSEGCKHCYAEALDKRMGRSNWGIDATRSVTSATNWRQPLAWNKAAERGGVRRRVFCASLADVFEDRPDLLAPRARLATMIATTPHLDWLLLTKRPENAQKLWDIAWGGSREMGGLRPTGANIWLPNLWLGTTCEDQRWANERLPDLLKVPASVRFVSYEPALGPIDFVLRGSQIDGWDEDLKYDVLRGHVWASPRDDSEPSSPKIDWVIVGGESGNNARPFDLAWARSVVAQCKAAEVSCFVKQLGAVPRDSDTLADMDKSTRDLAATAFLSQVHLRDRKGGDWDEWSKDLRVREWPR